MNSIKYKILVITSFILMALLFASCTQNKIDITYSSSIVDFLKLYRNEQSLSIFEESNNPYRIVCKNKDNSKTLYIFSSPVWKSDFSGFIETTINDYESEGFSVNTKYLNEDTDGFYISDNKEHCNIRIVPSQGDKFNHSKIVERPVLYNLNSHAIEYEVESNGVMYAYSNANGFTLELNDISAECIEKLLFDIEVSQKGDICNKTTYAAIMQSEKKPLFIVKTMSLSNKEIAEVEPVLSALNNKYELSFKAEKNNIIYDRVIISFEKYVNSSIYDTAVHSKHELDNEVYSNHVSVGKSCYWGDEWCYYRISETQLSNFQISDMNILNSQINFYNFSEQLLDVKKERMTKRWCSFNTLWSNRISGVDCGESLKTNTGFNFLSFDYSEESDYILREKPIEDFGALMKPKYENNNDYMIVATADNYNNPVFIELVYK